MMLQVCLLAFFLQAAVATDPRTPLLPGSTTSNAERAPPIDGRTVSTPNVRRPSSESADLSSAVQTPITPSTAASSGLGRFRIRRSAAVNNALGLRLRSGMGSSSSGDPAGSNRVESSASSAISERPDSQIEQRTPELPSLVRFDAISNLNADSLEALFRPARSWSNAATVGERSRSSARRPSFQEPFRRTFDDAMGRAGSPEVIGPDGGELESSPSAVTTADVLLIPVRSNALTHLQAARASQWIHAAGLVLPNSPRSDPGTAHATSDEPIAQLPRVRRVSDDVAMSHRSRRSRPMHTEMGVGERILQYDAEMLHLRSVLRTPYAACGAGALGTPGRPSMDDLARAERRLAEMAMSDLRQLRAELEDYWRLQFEDDETWRIIVGTEWFDHVELHL